MKVEIIAAFIAVGGTFFTAIVTIGIYFFTRRYDYNRLFAETISTNRMEWINVWRENVSEFLAIAEEIHFSGSIQCERSIKYKTAKNMVLTRLNMGEELHRFMFQAVNALDCRSRRLDQTTIYSMYF